MAIKMVPVKCPECNANLQIEEGRSQAYCTYCGTKIIINNENEFVFRTIDEAGIKKAETERIVKLRQLDIADKIQQRENRNKRIRMTIACLIGIPGLIAIAIGFSNEKLMGLALAGMLALMGVLFIFISGINNNDGDNVHIDGTAKVPDAIIGYELKNFQAIEAAFKSAGFTNIQCIPLKDLRAGLFFKPGMVESISINGKNVIQNGKTFPSDATVIISYHSFS